MIASLPMYDRPETAKANDLLWQGIRNELGHGPQKLSRGGDMWKDWLSPDLLLSQTCGYPYRARLHGQVALVGTPDHGLPGCPPGYYYSAIIARRDDPRKALPEYSDACFAYNSALSQSGWAAPYAHAQSMGFSFTNLLKSGGHALSALAVAEGRADIAAIDGLTWDMFSRYDYFSKDLKIVTLTEPTPALPYITATENDSDAIFAAMSTALANLTADTRKTLGLTGLVKIDAQDYLDVPNPPDPAEPPTSKA